MRTYTIHVVAVIVVIVTVASEFVVVGVIVAVVSAFSAKGLSPPWRTAISSVVVVVPAVGMVL